MASTVTVLDREQGTATAQSPAEIHAQTMGALRKARQHLSFRAVNTKDAPDYDPGLQRHHLLPRQLLSHRCFGKLFDFIGRDRLGFEDFRANGLLLPANDVAVLRVGLPMHRGPHRDYNQLVMERVGQVEARWAGLRLRAPEIALDEAVQRISLLQKALRRRLLNPRRKPLVLNRFDPIGQQADFTEIDAMVDMLWPETGTAMEPNADEMSLIAPGEGSAGRSAFSF